VERLQRSSFARQADAYACSPSVTQAGLLEWLARVTEVAPGARVLDVACGTCHITSSFARRGCLVTGVDLTLEMLHPGRRSLPPETRSRVQLLCGRAGSLPIPDGVLDLCVCRSAFHHFADPLESLLEMKRVTRRGGRVATLDHVASEHSERARRPEPGPRGTGHVRVRLR
jgi:ubiquinone/menaquinone biosynthesis C-methylase UbiE